MVNHIVDLLADCYFEISINDAIRAKHGMANKLIVKSAHSKVPSEFSRFLSCGENKTMLFQLVFETLTNKKHKALETLQSDVLVQLREVKRKLLTKSGTEHFDTPKHSRRS
jgi:hypothetical protein